jgi:hypothetical protein
MGSLPCGEGEPALAEITSSDTKNAEPKGNAGPSVFSEVLDVVFGVWKSPAERDALCSDTVSLRSVSRDLGLFPEE